VAAAGSAAVGMGLNAARGYKNCRKIEDPEDKKKCYKGHMMHGLMYTHDHSKSKKK